jgi:hypothetical protein
MLTDVAISVEIYVIKTGAEKTLKYKYSVCGR